MALSQQEPIISRAGGDDIASHVVATVASPEHSQEWLCHCCGLEYLTGRWDTEFNMTSTAVAIAAPEVSEFAPYYGRYISLVPGNDVIGALEQQGPETVAMLSGVAEQQGAYRYAPEKWSLKEVLGHVTDSERVFAYRALRIARNDSTPLPGFEQDDYVRAAMFGNRALAGLLDEFVAVRQASLLLFRSLDAEAWMRRGVADQKEVSVRALAYIIAGHELHHRKIIPREVPDRRRWPLTRISQDPQMGRRKGGAESQYCS
jgi:hypothetical protein